jgi:hypothetical protein
VGVGIAEGAEPVEERELFVGKIPLGPCLLEQSLKGRPLEVIPPGYAEKCSEHMFNACLGAEDAAKEEAVKIGPPALFEGPKAHGASVEHPVTIRPVLFE